MYFPQCCFAGKKKHIYAHIYQAGSGFTKRTRSYFREYLLVSSEQINHRICIYILEASFQILLHNLPRAEKLSSQFTEEP